MCVYICIYMKPLLPYKNHHGAEEEGALPGEGAGLEMSADPMGWRRAASNFRVPH